MSDRKTRHSSKGSDASASPDEKHSESAIRRFPSHALTAATKSKRRKSFRRAVKGLLNTPQSARSAGTGTGRGAWPSRRGSRSPVEPLFSSPLRISSSTMASAPNSPGTSKTDVNELPRRSSERIDEKDRRASTGREVGQEDDMKSDASSSIASQTATKRRSLGGKSMVAMMSGLESKLFPRSLSRGREASNISSRRGSSLDSRSPSTTLRPGRSMSPSQRSSQSISKPTFSSTEKANSLSMEDAHNKSDETLAKPSSTGLPDYVKPSIQEEGERLAKDVFDRDNNIIDSSDEDDGDYSHSEDDQIGGFVPWRGRKKRSVEVSVISPTDFADPEDESKEEDKPRDTGEKKKTNKPRVSFASERPKPRKSALKTVVHPQTSYDIPAPAPRSAAGTPYGSEDEAEKEDIARAQKLSISMSAIDNRVPNRSIRTIIRGNFAGLQEEAEGGRRRQRKYLVALDLSEESEYALEWTIGAVLRNGDTMFAIYAMHEDMNASSVGVGDGAKAMRDAAAVVGTQTREATLNHGRALLGRLGPGIVSKSTSADARASPTAEAERVRAVETISNKCISLIRKTLLQVRIAVEVIHCRSPKHMVTEAIDELEPTLVVVGARGQSALKGVLLGSFSNYLVSSSSVPVMVTRRRLKRNPSKGGTSDSRVRLSNNLPKPRSLMDAKVD